MSAQLLYYRPWQGTFKRREWSVWPVARTAMSMVFRRKLFWVLYALALLLFLMFFFGQYLIAWGEGQAPGEAAAANPMLWGVLNSLKKALKLDGSAECYRTFFSYQGYMVMVMLAMAGSIMVGNDFHHGSLPFYLSKPLSAWHYLLGKCIAVGLFVNLMTTLPAVVLFCQYRTLYSWGDFHSEERLLRGILGYGMVLTVVLSLTLVATATWLRRTVPLIMVWTALFLFVRLLTGALVDGLHLDARWRLFDLWNDMYVVGSTMLGLARDKIPPSPQPAWYEAAFVLGALCVLCLSYLSLRIRAVEVVR